MRRRAGFFLAICVSVAIMYGCSAGELPSAPTAVPTIAPTATVQSTVAPLPTNTQRPRPTNTPRATATRGKSITPFFSPTRAPAPPTPTLEVSADTATPQIESPTETVPPTINPTQPVLRPTATGVRQSKSPTPESRDFQFLSQNDYTNLTGDAVVVGLIKYVGAVPIGNVEIGVDLEDNQHSLLATQKADTAPSLVQPGGLIPFKATFTNPPSDFQFYNTTVQGDQVDQATIDQYTSDFGVIQPNLVAGADPSSPSLVGKVQNNGKTTATDTLVIAALLGADGKVLDVGSAYTTLSTISPGQQSSFEITFDNGDGGTDFRIVASANVQ